jgi:hypothetical protein
MSANETPSRSGEPVLAWIARRAAAARQRDVEFDDPRLEYRRLFSEVWGTFLLVLVAAGGGVIGATAFGSELTLQMKALAPGMMVMGIIFFMGTISGAHLNPAVTLAFAVRGNFPWRRVPRATSSPRSSVPCSRPGSCSWCTAGSSTAPPSRRRT